MMGRRPRDMAADNQCSPQTSLPKKKLLFLKSGVTCSAALKIKLNSIRSRERRIIKINKNLWGSFNKRSSRYGLICSRLAKTCST